MIIDHQIRPGDLGEIVRLHGIHYAAEHGFDARFEAYVAEPLARMVIAGGERSGLWLARSGEAIVGSIAMVETDDPVEAQLRWYLVVPAMRGTGIGSRLLDRAISFARAAGYRCIVLWTVSALEQASHRYRRAGFVKVEELPESSPWGVPVIEEKYRLDL